MSGPEKRNYGMSMERGSSVPSHVAPGTACAPCTAKGHFCAAYEIIGGRAVCLHCLDGVPCMRASRVGGVSQSPSAVLTSGHQLSGKEHEEVRLHYRAGKSLEWIAGQYGLSLIRLIEMVKEFPVRQPVPQPALAAGAVASPAMPLGTPPSPARRLFGHKTAAQRPWASKAVARDRAKAMLAEGKSMTQAMKATGLSRSTMARVRLELPGLSPARKGGRPKAGASPATTAESLPVNAVSAPKVRAKGDGVTGEYEVVCAEDVPGRVTVGAYDEIISRLLALPEGQALKRSFATAEEAEAHGDAVQRAALKKGIKISLRRKDEALFMWRRA